MSALLVLEDVLVLVAEGLRLEGVSLEVNDGESVAMVVKHGRTTLLRVAAGLRAPDAGKVLLRGKPIARALADISGEPALGFVFEEGGLLENTNVFDNAALPLRYHGKANERAIRERVEACLDVAGVADLATRFPFQLSRGQQRLAALARALAVEPALVYIDDLYRGASQDTWERFLAAMSWARKTHGTAFVTVLANADETPEGIDRLVSVKKVIS